MAESGNQVTKICYFCNKVFKSNTYVSFGDDRVSCGCHKMGRQNISEGAKALNRLAAAMERIATAMERPYRAPPPPPHSSSRGRRA